MLQVPKAKIPDVLVEHNSVMRGAIPCLPVPLAWFCLVWNFLLPGTGTVNLNIDTTVSRKQSVPLKSHHYRFSKYSSGLSLTISIPSLII